MTASPVRALAVIGLLMGGPVAAERDGAALTTLVSAWTVGPAASDSIASSAPYAWINVTPSSVPNASECSAMTYDPVEATLVCLGPSPNGITQVWTSDGRDWRDISPEVSPWVCVPAGAPVYDAADGRVFTFCDGQNGVGRTYEFSSSGWVNLTPTVLNASNSPVWWGPGGFDDYVYDPLTSAIVLVEGEVAYRPPSPETTTWTYSAGTWSNVTSASGALPPMSGGWMAFDPVLGGVLLWNSAVWLLKNGLWSNVTSWNEPIPGGAVGFDPTLGTLLLVDGSGGTWSLGSAGWTPLEYLVRPSPRNLLGPIGTYASVVYDSVVNTTFLLDPANGGSFPIGNPPEIADQVWRFTSAPSAPLPSVQEISVTPTIVATGSPFSVAVTVAGGDGPLSFDYRGLPLPCTSTNASRLSCTPGETGRFAISVTVTDSAGNEAFGEVNVTSLLGAGGSSPSIPAIAWVLFGVGVGTGSITVSAVWALARWRRARSPPPREVETIP